MLTTKDVLKVYLAFIERWCELTSKELREDMQQIDELHAFEKAYIRSYWSQRLDRLMESCWPKTEDDQEKMRSIYAVFKDQLNLTSSVIKEDVDARLNVLKRRVAEDYVKEIKKTIDDHDITSPIEQLFLMEWRGMRVDERLKVKLIPQKRVSTNRGSYKIDFLVEPESGEGSFRIALELDGHDFHEKTKQQVERDKKRERAIVVAGHTVFRFSGSEIVRNCRACVQEVEKFLKSKLR